MKLLLILSLIAMISARSPPYNPDGDVSLLKYDNDVDPNGHYKYAYEQSDGTKQEQEGYLENEGAEDEYYSVRGSFTWVGPDGIKYTVNYVADKDGYQPEIDQGPGGGVPPGVVASLLG